MFKGPYDYIDKDFHAPELQIIKKDVPLPPHKNIDVENQVIWSQFLGQEDKINNYADLFTPTDLSIIRKTLESMGAEMNLFSKEQAEELHVKPYWSQLSFFGKLFLLHTVENILGKEVMADDPDDSGFIAWAIISHCKATEENFFIKSLATSFTNENFRGEATMERMRSVVAESWGSCVEYSDKDDLIRVPDEVSMQASANASIGTDSNRSFDISKYEEEMKRGLPKNLPAGGKITIFNGEYQHIAWFDRFIERPEDLTDEECKEIYYRLIRIDDIDINYHTLEAGEWTKTHSDLRFEDKNLPDSMYTKFFARTKWDMDYTEQYRFAICKVSNDVHALYSSDTGEVIEYFQNAGTSSDTDTISACKTLREINGLLSSISNTPINGVDVENLTYAEMQRMFEWIIKMLPTDISTELKEYYEVYEQARAEHKQLNEHVYTPHSEGLFYTQYETLIAHIVSWAKELLADKKIPATPFDTLLHSRVDSSKSKELEFVYNVFTSMRMREAIEQSFGFSYEALDFRTQIQFISFLATRPSEYIDTIKLFVSKYGNKGIRTFLSLERGDETLGDSIVAFGQHDEVAGTVFRYYSELLDSADRAEELVRTVSNCEGDVCIDLANQVRENILNRAQKDLEEAVRADNPDQVANQIENYVATAKEYVALLQEVGTRKIESISPDTLTDEERVRMQELLHKNYDKTYPEPENNEFKAAVAGSLVKSFSSPNTTYRVLRDQGKIVSFNRFDTLRDYTGKEVTYFGSFNADSAYSGVGSVMLEKTIRERLSDGIPMIAHCDPTQAITKKYIEDGFVATGFYSLAGKPSFEIWRSKDSTAQLESKGKSIEELLALTEVSGSIVVREQSSADTYPELQKGMGLTRYFTHQGKTYLVFEKLTEILRSEFIPPQEELKKAA